MNGDMSYETHYTGDPDPDFIAEWQANLKARELYDRGVNYPALSVVIAEYHGVSRTKDQWRDLMRRMGAKPRATRGPAAARAKAARSA